jgi:hypothetical protein
MSMPIRSHLSAAAALAALAASPALAAPAKDDPAPTDNPAACYIAVTPATGERKPQIERGPASPDSAAAWYAVDRRESGCRKLVKMGTPAVSLPEPPREAGVVMATPGR